MNFVTHLRRWLGALMDFPNLPSRIEKFIMSAKLEILAAIAAERAQFIAKIEEVLASKNEIPDADKAEILAAIRGIVPDDAPAEGTHNISIAVVSEGDETVTAILKNDGADEVQVASLTAAFDSAVVAGEAQPAAGASFISTASLTVDGATRSATFTNEAQKAAFDKAIGEALVAIASAQLSALG